MKKTLAALTLAAGTALTSVPASAYVVAGIDFGSSTSLTHLETETLAQQFINVADASGANAGTGSGMGYGYITTVNGNANYCVAGSGCGLYYTVEYTGGTYTAGSGGLGTFTFTGTTIKIYYLSSYTNLLYGSTNSVENLSIIEAGTLYATLVGHGNLGSGLAANIVSYSAGNLTGATITFTGSGLLDVDSSDSIYTAFESYLNGNLVPDAAGGMADIAYTESVNNYILNANDIADGLAVGCKTGTAASGQWCLQGSLNTRGTGIPEPATLALAGLGLLGMGALRRRKSAKQA